MLLFARSVMSTNTACRKQAAIVSKQGQQEHRRGRRAYLVAAHGLELPGHFVRDVPIAHGRREGCERASQRVNCAAVASSMAPVHLVRRAGP